jgi:hypothetical protein
MDIAIDSRVVAGEEGAQRSKFLFLAGYGNCKFAEHSPVRTGHSDQFIVAEYRGQ